MLVRMWNAVLKVWRSLAARPVRSAHAPFDTQDDADAWASAQW